MLYAAIILKVPALETTKKQQQTRSEHIRFHAITRFTNFAYEAGLLLVGRDILRTQNGQDQFRKAANVSILQRKSRFAADVQKPVKPCFQFLSSLIDIFQMGETASSIRTLSRMGAVSCRVATADYFPRTRPKQISRFRMTVSAYKRVSGSAIEE